MLAPRLRPSNPLMWKAHGAEQCLAGAQRAAGFGGISLVQMKGADSDWMGMTNKYGQAWEVPVTPKLPWCGPALADRANCLYLWLHAHLVSIASS